MIPYNTKQEKLVLPEYGRIVHEMVKICTTIEDRDLRNEFAAQIVETMKSMTQEKGKMSDDRKYWDHLFIISNSELDVDSPYGKPGTNVINQSPNKIPYSNSDFGRRHYGNIIQKMVHQVALMPNSQEKDACVELLANHIKKLLVMNNTEHAEDSRVYNDLNLISGGSIAVEEGIFDLPEFKEDVNSKSQKRKKK